MLDNYIYRVSGGSSDGLKEDLILPDGVNVSLNCN